MNSPRSLTEDEWAAYERVLERLLGFDRQLDFEAVEGRLCALACGPHALPAETWLPALFGQVWERAFADPEDHARGLAALASRLAALQSQLDPEALMDDPETLRLDPSVAEWDEAAREQALAAHPGQGGAAHLLRSGVVWADAFVGGVNALQEHWRMPEDAEFQDAMDHCIAQVQAVFLDPASPEYAAHLAKFWNPPERLAAGVEPITPTHEEILAEALYAVQDIRVLFVDYAPVVQPIRAERTPGRNDPCPCGSGRKYKKCHGASA